MTLGLTIGEKLRDERTNKRITIKEVCNKIQISEGVLSDYENDKKKPGAEALAALALFYNVSVDYLLGLSECKSNANDKTNKETGLSEESINALKELKSKMNKNDPESSAILYFINSLIQDKNTIEELARCIVTLGNLNQIVSKEEIGKRCIDSLGNGGIMVTGNDAAEFLLFQGQQAFIKFIKGLNRKNKEG